MEEEIYAEIVPSILIWARERISITHEVLSKKTFIAETSLMKFESGEKYPTFTQLRKLSNFFRMNVSVFFLSEPPTTKDNIKASLRRLAGERISIFSTELKKEIFTVLSKREELIELGFEDGIWPLFSINEDSSAQDVRNKINLRFEIQKKWKDPRLVFNSLREMIESIGILVFQISGIDIGEMRACAIYDNPLPIIILNRGDTYNGRTFSLAHELFHIIRKHDDVLINGNDGHELEENSTNESLANRFAVDFLMPKPIYDHYVSGVIHFEDKYELISIMSRDFGVSKEVVARKLLDDKIIDSKVYTEIRNEGIKNAKKRKKGMVMPYTDSISLYGKPFSRVIISNLEKRKIDKAYACDLLEIKTKWLPFLIQSL
jgi:Zn-dependent peptidase ImmA (M78 family)